MLPPLHLPWIDGRRAASRRGARALAVLQWSQAHDLCRIPGFKEGDGMRRYMHGDHRSTRGGGPGRGLARVAASAAPIGSCASCAATDVIDTSGALVAGAGL